MVDDEWKHLIQNIDRILEFQITALIKAPKKFSESCRHRNYMWPQEIKFVDSLVYKTASLTAQMVRHISENMKLPDYVVSHTIGKLMHESGYYTFLEYRNRENICICRKSPKIRLTMLHILHL